MLFKQALSDAGLSGPDAQPDATPQSDGIPNILKYAFNMNLGLSDHRQMTPEGTSGTPMCGLIEREGQHYWRIKFVQRKNSGLIYKPMWSDTIDYGSYLPINTAPVVSEINSDWDLVTYDEPCEPYNKSKHFTQVRVMLPYITKLALLGDSITDQNSDTQYYYSMGYFTHAMNTLGWPLLTVQRSKSNYNGTPDWTHGYGAYSPQNIINGNRNNDGVYPMSDIGKANPEDVFVFIGSNTGAGDDSSSIIQIWDTLIAAGRRVYAAEILPRVEGASGYDASDLSQCYATNSALKVAANARGIPFLEWASTVALQPAGFANPEYFADGVHPNNLGAQLLGNVFADWIAPFCGLPYPIPEDGSQLWLTSNPYVIGDIGGLANGFTKTNPSGGSLIASKHTDMDGTEWQRLSSSQPSTYNRWSFRQSSGTGTYPAGSVVRLVARVRGLANDWDYKNIYLLGYATVNGVTTTTVAGNYLSATYLSNTAKVCGSIDYTIISPPYTIPPNTTAMWTYLQAAGSGTVDVRQIGVIKSE